MPSAISLILVCMSVSSGPGVLRRHVMLIYPRRLSAALADAFRFFPGLSGPGDPLCDRPSQPLARPVSSRDTKREDVHEVAGSCGCVVTCLGYACVCCD